MWRLCFIVPVCWCINEESGLKNCSFPGFLQVSADRWRRSASPPTNRLSFHLLPLVVVVCCISSGSQRDEGSALEVLRLSLKCSSLSVVAAADQTLPGF